MARKARPRHAQRHIVWLALAAMFAFGSRARVPGRQVMSGALSIAQLRELARATGFEDPNTAAAVAMAESGGDPRAVNMTEAEHSIGLWQINVRAWPMFDAARLKDPAYNARAALFVSQTGPKFWDWWTTFSSGAYKPFMPSGGGAA